MGYYRNYYMQRFWGESTMTWGKIFYGERYEDTHKECNCGSCDECNCNPEDCECSCHTQKESDQ